jgi:ribosomal protein L37AE/L43A
MNLEQKIANKKSYHCENCEYTTNNKFDFSKHLLTPKHIKRTELCDLGHKIAKNRNEQYACSVCNKPYNSRNGLWYHEKKCKTTSFERTQSEPPTQGQPVDMSVVLELLKQNQEFKDLLIEQNKQMLILAQKAGNHNNINTNCNNNNKFNLNFFLNETCKDAITFSDFINSIEVTMDEFVQTGNTGFVNGISQVLMDRIKGMDLHTRPLHCTDFKRETVYIKNEEKWDKEDGDKSQLRKAVKCVAKKNYNQLHQWYNNKKPDVEILGTEECEDYFKFYKSALGGYDKEEDKKFEDKIIKNVLKEVILDKSITDAE